MKKKYLIDTNPYLSDPLTRDRLVTRSVRSSCAVEGIKATITKIIPISNRKDKKIYAALSQ